MEKKRKSGVVGDLVNGAGGLIIAVVIILVIVSTLLGANLLTGTENTTAQMLSSNFTSGIDQVATKLPTIFLIAAVVLLFGVLVVLVVQAKRSGLMGSGSGSL